MAVVLFNLGAPDRPEAIRPFLRNLFADPAILRVPPPIRPLLAAIITARRVRPATENYMLLGGSSPLLAQTRQQADAIEAAITESAPDCIARCFIAMRYWDPRADATMREVASWAPDEVLLLPLYPHFSTTTTGSSLLEWRQFAAKRDLVVQTSAVCCWYLEPGYVQAYARLLRAKLDKARAASTPGSGSLLRVMFSAHGLPQTIVDRGDPYQMQIEASALAIADAAGLGDMDDVDTVVCYQSRATPQQWLEPSTEQALEAAAHDGRLAVVVPLAFVSEHSETLVELDIEYRTLAERLGLPGYLRVPTPTLEPEFIGAVADIALRTIADGPRICPAGGRICGTAHPDCPQRRLGRTEVPA